MARWGGRICSPIGLTLGVSVGCLACGAAPDKPPSAARWLVAGSTVEAALAPGEEHLYRVELARDQALDLLVEQSAADLVVTVSDPHGRELLQVDSPIGKSAPESVCFVAKSVGTHELRVRSWQEREHGPYTLKLRIRPATPEDRQCFAASQLVAAVEKEHPERDSAARSSAYAQALDGWRAAGYTLKAVVARCQLARLLARQNRARDAVTAYDQALTELRQLGPGAEPGLAAMITNERGLQLLSLSELDLAAAAFRAALTLAQSARQPANEAAAWNNLARLANTQGDFPLAIQHGRQALALWRELGDRREEAATLTLLGENYLVTVRLKEAEDLFAQALALQRQLGARMGEANTSLWLGWVHFLAGQPERALPLYRRARALYAAAGWKTPAGVVDRIGSAYRDLGESTRAQRAFALALRRAEVGQNPRDIAHTLFNLADLARANGQLEAARTQLERAMGLLRALGDRNTLAHALTLLAQIERDQGNLAAAHTHLAAAVETAEARWAAGFRQGAYLRPTSLRVDIDALYVDLLMDLAARDPGGPHAAAAFVQSDLARGRNLNAMLRDAGIGQSEPNPELQAQEAQIQERLYAAQQHRADLLAQDPAAAALQAVDAELRALRLEAEAVQQEIREQDPRRAAAVESAPSTLAAIQSLLDPQTVLLSFVLAEPRSFVFVVTPTRLSSHVLPARQEIETLARTVYTGLRSSQQRRATGQSRATAQALSQLLLAPLAADLQSLPELARWVIVSEGALQYIPLAALPLPHEWRLVAGKPLPDDLILDHYELVQGPSAAVLYTLRQRQAARPTVRPLLTVVADPVFSPDDPRVDPKARADAAPREQAALSRRGLLRLPFARREAEAILALAPSGSQRAVLDFAASRDRVLDGALRDASILHFATHGILDEEHPELSGLALSRVDRQGRPVQGDLYLHDIYRLKLSADLVVLSACDTALGPQIRGEGLIGLTRGFFYAGASRLLVSLWPVEDAATAVLMTEFYRGHLRLGLTPAAALRAAQRYLRREPRWQEPAYWAGFVLQGEWQ